MKGVVLTWGSDVSRSRSLAREFGYEDLHISPFFSNRNYLIKGFDYVLRFAYTLVLLVARKPDCLIVVSPPVFPLYIALVYRFFRFGKVRLLGDFHNGVLRKEWLVWPLLKHVVRSFDCVISHNPVVKKAIDVEFLVDSVVLSDPLAVVASADLETSARFIKNDRVNILVPVSYAKDEPIFEIIEAARLLGDTHNFILTGNFRKMFDLDEAESLPVSFTGFIDRDVYWGLMEQSDCVLCLTNNDDIQMCALIEAISLSKQIVCTDNSVNRTMFSGFVFSMVDNTALALSQSMGSLPEQAPSNMAVLKCKYENAWKKVAEDVLER